MASDGPGVRDRRQIRVAIVDDHPAVVDAIAAAIEASPDLRLVGKGSTFGEASRLTTAPPEGPDRPDVVVCDMQLAGEAEGLRLLELARRSSPAILILSSYDQAPLVRAAFERGAAGYLPKTAAVSEILAAIRVAANGGASYSAAMLRAVRTAPRRPSHREIEVLTLVCAGASNDEIGLLLHVSERTVESHLRRLFDRYGVVSRTELAVLALREGWVNERGSA